MVKKIVFNLLKVLIIFILLQVLAVNSAYVQASTWSDIFESAEGFIEKGENELLKKDPITNKMGGTIDNEKIKNVSNIIYNILFGIGVALSVVVGAVLGIKFMTSSVDEKAQIKEALIPYVAGCVVVFGSFGIWRLVMVIGANL